MRLGGLAWETLKHEIFAMICVVIAPRPVPDRPLMERRDAVSPETLAAQALGQTDAASGGLVPAINLSTNYEQRPDGSYPRAGSTPGPTTRV